MNKIKLLDDTLINKIAAGEVIDRPSSVVKELVENSIDAQSTKIMIYIEGGGIKKIQVRDNGIGIEKDSIPMAFKRHATSKISKNNDLFNINTLGFRGEALPSIGSISRVLVESSHNNSDGYSTNINYGLIDEIQPSSISSGTNVVITDLFTNVPARMKFLKAEKTELNSIYKYLKKVFISFPSIHFILNVNSKEIYNLIPDRLINRINEIFSNIKENLIPISYSHSSFKISGYIGNLTTLKKSNSEQFLFVNNRSIKSKSLSKTIMNCFQNLISRGEYPFYSIFIDIDSKEIDVNVHPQKSEIKFKNEWVLIQNLSTAIKVALKNKIHVLPRYSNKFNYDSANNFQQSKLNLKSNKDIEVPTINPINDAESFTSKVDKAVDRIESHFEPELINEYIDIDKIHQIHKKYLLTEISSGLILVDQHVAHERVIFEQAVDAINNSALTSQTLLFPITIKLTPERFGALSDIYIYLKRIGFDIREFGVNTIIVEGVPLETRPGNEEIILNEILDVYLDQGKKNADFIDIIAASYSCKAAIKAGEFLEPVERQKLINNLFSTKHPYYCPHGRPIIVKLDIDEIDKRFERY